MKKIYLTLCVAALALVSCVKTNDVYTGTPESRQIAFSPLAQNGTKAISNTNYGYIDGTTFDTSWGMTVSAYDVTNTRQLFAPSEFSYNSSHWSGSQYWPLSAVQVNFLAIAHANADNSTGVTWTVNNTPVHQVEVVMSDNYPIASAQRDFIYAMGNGAVVQDGNSLQFPDDVGLTFKHTQAYLVFNLKAADAASCGITITDVKIKGAHTSGTATIARVNAGTYADASESLYWESTGYHTDATTLESITAAQSVISTALTQEFVEMGHLLVVPNMSAANTFAEGGFTSFEISYSLGGNAYTYEYVPVSTKLEAGKKYIYDITFQLHEIYVDPSVTDWQADESGPKFIAIPAASMAYNDLADVSLDNAAGVYSFTVSGFTAGQAVSVAEKSDDDGIISHLEVPATVPASGVVMVEVTKPLTANDKNAVITLTVNSVDYDITIKTPVTEP